MLEGKKIKACSHCYYQENIGRTSYRESFNKTWLRSGFGKDILERVQQSRTNGYRVEKQPLYLDIRPGNLCNLKCRMCNPGNSSKIYREQKELLKNRPSEFTPLIDTGYFKRDEKKFHSWYQKEEIWSSIYKWAPGVKQLYFTGGEPTLIKENWKLMDYVIKEGYSKNIDLIFNLNCTQVPDKLIDTFKVFSSVTITFSVDGYGEVQEYIRHPSLWKDISANVIKMLECRRENTQFYFSPVVQVYNILDLPRLLKWVDVLSAGYGKIGNSLIMCTDPEFLDIAILPKNIKEKALQGIEDYERSYKGYDLFFLGCLKSIKNILRAGEKPGTDKQLKRFYKYTNLLDEKRSENFAGTFPELNRLLDEDGRWKN